MEFNTKHPSLWHWWVSGLLLLATMLNYMDRQTLANLSVRITQEFELNQEQYGTIEFVFGIGFAIGSLCFGAIADKVSVRLLYPVVLIGWSAVGLATGMTNGYPSMLACRALLGFFESGHWPCALIVTQRILSSGDRVMGNSVLQSGASLGAIFTPLIIRAMVGDNTAEGAWRFPFYVIGALGVVWMGLWFISIPKGELGRTPSIASESINHKSLLQRIGESLTWLVEFIADRRFWALAAMVISINTSWQLIRAWLPKFLQEGRNYSEKESLYFNSAYYVATDVGCILAGVAGMWLVKRGLSSHQAKLRVFACCAILAALTNVAAWLPAGWPLLGILLLVGAGCLGLFPCYYSFTQELSTQHMGKLTGLLSAFGWFVSSFTQPLFGKLADQLGSFDLGLMFVGWSPLIGLLVFMLLWRTKGVSH